MSKQNLPPIFLRVRQALTRRGRSRHDADDIAQEAWIRLIRHEQAATLENPEGFMMRTAFNLSIDVHRSDISRGQELALDDVVLAAESPNVEEVVLGRERMGRLAVCLGRLAPKTREILLAHRLDGLSYREIADHHGLSISTVEKHIAKATLQLMTWMEDW